MPIEIKNNRFHLYNDEMSYVIEASEYNDLINLHFGASVDYADLFYQTKGPTTFTCFEKSDMWDYTLSLLPQEYPTSGSGDFRSPAIEITTHSGVRSPRLKYTGYKVIDGKPGLSGLPAVYTENDSEAQTLVLTCEDEVCGVRADLYYTVFADINVICRHSEITNIGNNTLTLRNAQSISLDFPAGEYEYIHLEGAWAREKHIERNAVHKGSQGFESRRGASGHTENPFVMFFDKGADEDFGNVWGVSLVYSGNHKFLIEREADEAIRLQAGINPFDFNFKLDKGESFVTPEAVVVYSNIGFSKMSQTFHKLYRTRLCRGKYRDLERPILVNNWEGTYFDFNKEKLLSIVDAAAKIGLELFVLDDGWFGKRENETTSLGDWVVNEKKLGCTIGELADEVNKRGLKFGLWFEPEMISEESELFRNHPEFVIKIPDRTPMYGRHQWILDLTRPDVREYIIKALSNVLESANIEYVKWDMNRNMTDVYSETLPADRQGEFYHRYILGLYEVLEKLTAKFPDILFEGCSGGGGRNDPGMLYYMPQFWASDDTDANERLYIQYGSSMVYPVASVGSHVSAVPNHQIGRTSSLSKRGTVAMNGAFGYELDLSKCSDDELDEMKKQVEFYKKNRELVLGGDYYRLLSPFESRFSSWMYVSEDKKHALVYFVLKEAKPSAEIKMLKLKGLCSDYKYKVGDKVYSGKTLMNHGIMIEGNQTENFNFIIEIDCL